MIDWNLALTIALGIVISRGATLLLKIVFATPLVIFREWVKGKDND